MKVEIDKRDFLGALSKVQNVVHSKVAMKALGNVLVEAKGDILELTTTDLDMGISTKVKAKIKKEGETTIPVKNLTSIIRELPEGNLRLEVNDKNVTEIHSGSIYFKLLGLPSNEFPTFLDINEEVSLSLNAEVFSEAIHLTSYAMSRDPLRYVLNGLLFSFESNKLTLVATDSRRLATYDLDVDKDFGDEKSVIVPSKAINELHRLMADNGEVTMVLDEGKVAFKFDETVIISKIIDSKFPNYKKALPGESVNKIIFDRESLLSAIRRVSLISFDEISTVRVCLKENEMEILSNNPELGSARDSIPIKYKGDEYDIIYNATFFMEPLKYINDDEVFLEIFKAKNECVIQTNNPFVYVLMPMTLD